LLKLAICLFPLDVGVRRIQLEREQLMKALAFVRRKLFFWEGIARPVEADESLTALLARRDQVRAKQTAPAVQPAPELFQPTRPATVAAAGSAKADIGRASAVEPARPEEKKAEQPVGTTSRLLEAKRRAQRK
jgi:hypothetical protein